jgi:multiple sugar transport system substrate-binding protein
MKNNNYKIKIFFLILFIVFLPGFGLKCESAAVKQGLKPVSIEFWSAWDSPESFDTIIASYRQLHPNVTIVYKKFRYEEYERELINAFAEDRGPDIFSLHNTWMQKYKNKLEPVPPQITMVYPTVKGTIKKEVVAEIRTTNSMTVKELQEKFVDAVAYDAVMEYKDEATGETKPRIFGLPLAIDTLALYYNKDLLNNAGIPNPPSFWDREFQQNVKKLTKQDNKGQIVQSGVALGGSTNVERFTDILSLLMMQNGTVMMDERGRVTFNSTPDALRGQGYNPGFEALRFYTDFANPAKEVYSWNSTLDNSLDMFIRGKLAFMFGYAFHLPIIKAGAPKLNFSIAPMLQIEGNANVNFANYWLQVVSKKSKNKDVAWDFIQFAAGEKRVQSYLDATNKPTALRSLLAKQNPDDDTSVFAGQVLSAKSWYRGSDSPTMEKIMAELIDSVVTSELQGTDMMNAMNNAAKKVQQTVE